MHQLYLKMKKKIRIAYVDCLKIDVLKEWLQDKFDLIIDWEKPDFLFYSNYESNHLRYKDCVKIFVNYENCAPDFNQCDYAISAVKQTYGDRCFWYPLAAQTKHKRIVLENLDDATLLDREFCSFIYSQSRLGAGAKARTLFCQKLQEAYKPVACPGAVLHNVDAPELSERYDVANWIKKIKYLSKFKFNIAFENSDAPGYITEKLMDCYLAGVVPIYWGSLSDLTPFPKESMICAADYADISALIQRVKEVDNDDELYLSIVRANPLLQGEFYDFEEKCKQFLERVIDKGNAPYEKDTYLVSDTSRFIRASRGVLRLWLNCAFYATVAVLMSLLKKREKRSIWAARYTHARWSLKDIRNARSADATDPRIS